MQSSSVVLAGGCFWCLEKDLTGLAGVLSVLSGYMGGSADDAHYKAVCSHATNHREVVQVEYAPQQISYQELIRHFLLAIDPTDSAGQFADRGRQYQPVIYTHGQEEAAWAQSALEAFSALGVHAVPLAVAVEPRTEFYPAEDYHQRYAEKNADHYHAYRVGSGREHFVNACRIKYKNATA